MAEVQTRDYDVILAPLITEKATLVAEENKIIFRVPLEATKEDIKRAVESLFKVDVTKVNTLRVKGKTKRFRGHLGRRSCDRRHPGGGGDRRRECRRLWEPGHA